MGTTGQETTAQQRAECYSSRKCWTSAWATPMNSSCKCQRRSLRHIMLTPLLCKASLTLLMAEGVHQWLCTTRTVAPEIPYSGERQEVENLPKQLEKAYRHEGMPEGILYPGCFHWRTTYGFCSKSLCHLRNHDTCAKGSANISSPSSSPPSFPSYNLYSVSTPPLVNHCWLTWLVNWWPLDLYKYIATTLFVWPLCSPFVHLPPGLVLVSGEPPRLSMAGTEEGLSPQGDDDHSSRLSVSEPQTGKKDCPLAGV